MLTWGFAKPLNHKRKLRKDQFQHGQQKGLADALHTSLDLPLADLIHTGDVVHALDAVQVALVHAVNADEACAPSGTGCLAHANGVAHRAGLGETGALALVASTFAQVVKVRR